jgi:hypothetical protein
MTLVKLWGSAAILTLTVGCTQGEPPASNPPSQARMEASGGPYIAEVTKFREDREAALKGNAGWLTIAGLWFLTQPRTTFGSDPLNDIVFPASAPALAGTFEMREGKVTVRRKLSENRPIYILFYTAPKIGVIFSSCFVYYASHY